MTAPHTTARLSSSSHSEIPAKTAPLRDLVLLGVLALLWGSSYLFIKIAVETIPPVTLIAVRVTIAAVILTMIAHWRGATFPRDGKTWKMLLVQAFCNSIGAWTLLAWAQQYVDSALAGVLNSTSPIFVFFFTLLVTRHEALNGWKLAGALLGLCGVVLIVGLDTLGGLGQNVLAQGAILLSAMLYAGAAIYGKRFGHLAPTITAAGTMIWGAICLVPLSLIIDQPWTLEPSARSLAAALALTLLSNVCALLIYFRVVKTLGSMGVASQSYLRAGVSVLLGVVLLGETLTLGSATGLAAIILGVIAINAAPLLARVSR